MNQIQTEDVESKKKWDEFLDWINSTSTNYYFRGESNIEYLLRPKIGRNNYSLSDELNMFEHFKLRTSLYINAKNDFEWLAIAQHHGLPTRLLDWSLNPLVACFFAITSNSNKNGRIYKVDSSKNDTIDIKKYNSPFEIDKIHFLHPPASTRRIELQKGLFSLHPLPKEPLLIGSRYLYDADEKEILIEIENNYHFNEKPKPFFSAENYEYDIKNYLKVFYINKKPYFEIESFHKPYFEKRIRLLGVDETIYGDIDSISKNIEYLKQNNNLNHIILPNFENVKPFWKKCIENQIIEYFETKNNIFNSLTNIKNFDRKVFVSNVELIYKAPRNNTQAEISCTLYFRAYPNYEDYDEIKFISRNRHVESNLFSIERTILKDKYNSGIGECNGHVDLNIEISTQDFKEKYFTIREVKIKKFEFLNQFNLINDEFIIAENRYKILKKIFSKKDLIKMDSKTLNEKEIKLMANKYETKFINSIPSSA